MYRIIIPASMAFLAAITKSLTSLGISSALTRRGGGYLSAVALLLAISLRSRLSVLDIGALPSGWYSTLVYAHKI